MFCKTGSFVFVFLLSLFLVSEAGAQQPPFWEGHPEIVVNSGDVGKMMQGMLGLKTQSGPLVVGKCCNQYSEKIVYDCPTPPNFELPHRKFEFKVTYEDFCKSTPLPYCQEFEFQTPVIKRAGETCIAYDQLIGWKHVSGKKLLWEEQATTWRVYRTSESTFTVTILPSQMVILKNHNPGRKGDPYYKAFMDAWDHYFEVNDLRKPLAAMRF